MAHVCISNNSRSQTNVLKHMAKTTKLHELPKTRVEYKMAALFIRRTMQVTCKSLSQVVRNTLVLVKHASYH